MTPLGDLTTGRLSWRRLKSLVMHLPPEAATVRATNPDVIWGLEEHLLASIADQLAIANWQRTGRRNAPKPKPIRRPGVRLPHREVRSGTESLTVVELHDRLKRHRGGGDGS